MNAIFRAVATASKVFAGVAAPIAAPVGAFIAKHPIVSQVTPLFGFLSTFTLPIVGFGTGGVGAGTLAAGVQSAVYGGFVPAGSTFAVLQSVGATAGGPIMIAVQVGLAVASVAVPAIRYFKR